MEVCGQLQLQSLGIVPKLILNGTSPSSSQGISRSSTENASNTVIAIVMTCELHFPPRLACI